MRKLALLLLLSLALVACDCPATTEEDRAVAELVEEPRPERPAPEAMGMTTVIPEELITPDSVPSRLGDLHFVDGVPTDETVDRLYDNIDFVNGVRAYLNTISVASLGAMRRGLVEAGLVNARVGIYEDLMDSKSLFLTPNTSSVYTVTWLDLSDGPLVVESPPNTLGFVDDFFFHYVADMGNAGPDRGEGGKFLFLPPGYEGDIPEGYFVSRSATFGNWAIWRGFLVDGDPAPAVASIKKNLRIYPLSEAGAPPETEFVNLSGREINTIHATDIRFFEEVNQVVQAEPSDATDPETLGLLRAIGIIKGQEFAPDERMRAILSDAAAVANATARAHIFSPRLPLKIHEDGYWTFGFIGGSHEFLAEDARVLDARSFFHYYATGITPAMTIRRVGVGSQYAVGTRDSEGQILEGALTYRLHVPADVPARDFWSIVVYDNQTRSMLQTDQRFPSVSSMRGIETNDDGSVDIYFGPTAPAGVPESNWIQTIPNKGWNTLLRLYAPLEPWFEHTWRVGEIERFEGE